MTRGPRRQKRWHKQLFIHVIKLIESYYKQPEFLFTSISKSGRLKAVLNSEQKWAMAGTSHQDWISPTETVHPWDIFEIEKVCNL